MRTQIILQAKFRNGVYPRLVRTVAVVGMAGLMDGKQNLLQQVIYLIGEAEAFRQKWTEEARGFLQQSSVGTLVSSQGLHHQHFKIVSCICHPSSVNFLCNLFSGTPEYTCADISYAVFCLKKKN